MTAVESAVRVDDPAALVAVGERTPLARLGSAVVLVVLVGIWHVTSTWTFVIPPVAGTFSTLWENLGDARYREHLGYSVKNIGVAFAVSVGLGAVLGVAIGYLARVRTAIEAVVVSLNSVPKIVVYPLILPILQVGASSQIVMGVLHGVFPILIMVSGGVAQLPRIYGRLCRSLGATRRQLFVHVVLPAIRKPLLAGARLSLSVTIIGVVLAEFFSTRLGLGGVIAHSYAFIEYETLMGTTLILLALTLTASYALWCLERRLPE